MTEPRPPHGGEPCVCRSTARQLALVVRELDTLPELEALAASQGWPVDRALGVVTVRVGEGSAFAGAGEVADVLRATLVPAAFAQLRAAWVRADLPLLQQLPVIIHAEPLAGQLAAGAGRLLPVLEGGRIETWYQPVFWSGSLALWGYECLMRGRAEDGSLIPPATLLAWARAENLVFMLDRVARESHLRAAGRAGLPEGPLLLINFLPTAIYQPEFCLSTTVRAARESGIDADRIVFEVVESERVQDRDKLRAILQHYRDSGFLVALDDVGAGYAGLSMLGDLRPDLIKIDREMVEKAVTSTVHREICASLIALARTSSQLVLAEGVETEAQWRLMESLGAHLLQGYLFGRPDPVPAARPLVDAPPVEPRSPAGLRPPRRTE